MDLLLIQEQNGGGNIKWKTLEHYGPLFPADYKPHKTPLKYKDILIQFGKIMDEELSERVSQGWINNEQILLAYLYHKK